GALERAPEVLGGRGRRLRRRVQLVAQTLLARDRPAKLAHEPIALRFVVARAGRLARDVGLGRLDTAPELLDLRTAPRVALRLRRTRLGRCAARDVEGRVETIPLGGRVREGLA